MTSHFQVDDITLHAGKTLNSTMLTLCHPLPHQPATMLAPHHHLPHHQCATLTTHHPFPCHQMCHFSDMSSPCHHIINMPYQHHVCSMSTSRQYVCQIILNLCTPTHSIPQIVALLHICLKI